MALNVIALISGGKDSFFSLLHCMAHGHRVVALANLHPPHTEDNDGGSSRNGNANGDADADEADLNSFMYQTVGHPVLPLYAAATGLPLYRQPILGRAVQSGCEYQPNDGEDEDETESMTRLLRRVLADLPEANAVCAGALLSTYQRTRVESVAVRLGLASLAYLWQYPLLPAVSSSSAATTDYLDDLAVAGFDARIVKVASGGLDDSLLWTNVASAAGRARLQRALRRLGLADDGPGSMLGEGGEYETLVVDGPRALFRQGSLSVADADRRVVHEGGGTSWLQIRAATVEPREAPTGLTNVPEASLVSVRQPGLLDARFAAVLARLGTGTGTESETGTETASDAAQTMAAALSLADEAPFALSPSTVTSAVTTLAVVPDLASMPPSPSMADATRSIVAQVRQHLRHRPSHLSPTHSVIRTLVVLRRMADFPAFNAVYGTLFTGAPNPPSRVTIACGEALPADVDVAVFLSVLDDAAKIDAARRQGLHVQSRSYWAPANIGPYSQAVSVLAHADADADADDGNDASGPRVVSIAGQIPLVPATMDLPDQAVEAAHAGLARMPNAPCPSPASFAFQATLALQHLWRIGIDQDVQWWGSTVAYVPRQTDGRAEPSLSSKARLVARAWQTAHEWRPKAEDSTDDEEDDVDGPDLWDRAFDARYARYGAGGGGSSDENTPQLPDWRVLDGSALQPARAVPPVFLAEVHELPRAAPVEWHAQAGFGRLHAGGSNSSVQLRTWVGTDGAANKTWSHQTILKTLRPRIGDTDEDSGSEDDNKVCRPAAAPRSSSRVVVQKTTAWACPADKPSAKVVLPDAVLADNVDVVYADRNLCQISKAHTSTSPIVPCASLWNARGERLAAVVVQTVYGEA
ncbi:ATP-binding protein l-psp endoribonuclease family protein [Sporothrix brasiliensis 5110]|uniref:Diphthine--ammonia ligase n=1 Tax=Sporothrix brasiliensis 5110 TaxID=1398154 RepID=A0A0C2J1D5_9PEZI|nr:ATP-binding protein l-psp endoribonuclease family protein [Sporothrix brasiliensis 5110]KIH95136.1 ATP-binding protein l-psp endoribonuclease family protein [Sporothrix brasiliensis 5110]